jgi:hypothetical protein
MAEQLLASQEELSCMELAVKHAENVQLPRVFNSASRHEYVRRSKGTAFCGDPGWSPGQVMWDLRWTKW